MTENEKKALEEAKKRLENFNKKPRKKTSDMDEPRELLSGTLDEVALERTKKEDADDESK